MNKDFLRWLETQTYYRRYTKGWRVAYIPDELIYNPQLWSWYELLIWN